MTQTELQQDVQRFASEFMFTIAEGVASLEVASDPEVRAAAVRRALVYQATVLDIASGPYPEISLVDMLVFAALSRRALEEYWLPQKFGQEGAALLEAFADAERRLWELSGKILSSQDQGSVRELIMDWRRRHPDAFLVEGVRFEQFGYRAGEVAEERAARARGLLGQVRSATRAADEALVLGERALFVAHRLPFLVRMQARVGANDILGDSVVSLRNMQALFERVPELQSLLDELLLLTTRAGSAAREARLLAEVSEPLLDRLVGPDLRVAPDNRTIGTPADVLGRLDRITARSETMFRELREMLPEEPEETARAIEQRADGFLRRGVLYLLALGFGWALFFWTGYYLVKR